MPPWLLLAFRAPSRRCGPSFSIARIRGTRSYLIHRFGPLDADPHQVLSQLDTQNEVSIRRALILALVKFNDQRFPPQDSSPTDTAAARSVRQRS